MSGPVRANDARVAVRLLGRFVCQLHLTRREGSFTSIMQGTGYRRRRGWSISMDARLKALLAELESFGLENDEREPERQRRMLNITADTGRFLHILVQATCARRILEVGTSNGYSTIWLADAARRIGGKVTSVDVNEEKTRMAKVNLARAGLSEYVSLCTGDAAALIERLPDPFDLIFLDADRPSYLRYLELVLPRLRRGGLIVADNVVSHAVELKEYLQVIRDHPSLETVTLPVGKGEELTYKRA